MKLIGCIPILTKFKLIIKKNDRNENSIQVQMESTNLKKFRNNYNKNSSLLPGFNNHNLSAKSSTQNKFEKISSLKGWRLTQVECYVKVLINKTMKNQKSAVQQTLDNQKLNIFNTYKIKVSTLSINEEFGVRLALLFECIKTIDQMTKIDKALIYIKSLSKEEAYYWYSKCFINKNPNSGIRAFKILALS